MLLFKTKSKAFEKWSVSKRGFIFPWASHVKKYIAHRYRCVHWNVFQWQPFNFWIINFFCRRSFSITTYQIPSDLTYPRLLPHSARLGTRWGQCMDINMRKAWWDGDPDPKWWCTVSEQWTAFPDKRWLFYQMIGTGSVRRRIPSISKMLRNGWLDLAFTCDGWLFVRGKIRKSVGSSIVDCSRWTKLFQTMSAKLQLLSTA